MRPKCSDFRFERADFWLERADLVLERGGGEDVHTHGRMSGNSPMCLTGHWHFAAAALLSLYFLT